MYTRCRLRPCTLFRKMPTSLSAHHFNPSVSCGKSDTTRFNIQKSCFKPQSLFKFCVDLRIKRDYFPVEHQLTGFYNRDIVLNERYGLDLRVMYINPSNRVFSICTTRFNTQHFCVQPPVYLCVLCGTKNKQR